MHWLKRKVDIYNPFVGEPIPLEQVPDPVFSQKLAGDGFAVKPEGSQCRAPVCGKVKLVIETKHAICIETDEGLQVLIHIGLETVALQGGGFEAHVSAGDQVKTGDLLITFQPELIADKCSLLSPVVIPNMERVQSIHPGNADILYTVILK